MREICPSPASYKQAQEGRMPPLFNMGARKRGQKLPSHSSHSQSPNVQCTVFVLGFGPADHKVARQESTGHRHRAATPTRDRRHCVERTTRELLPYPYDTRTSHANHSQNTFTRIVLGSDVLAPPGVTDIHAHLQLIAADALHHNLKLGKRHPHWRLVAQPRATPPRARGLLRRLTAAHVR